jgi:hypothetical protein
VQTEFLNAEVCVTLELDNLVVNSRGLGGGTDIGGKKMSTLILFLSNSRRK